jgi:hypothetical protein
MTRILGATCAALAAVCLYFAHIADVQREEAMALKEQLVQQRASALHLSALVAAGTTTPASVRTKTELSGATESAPVRPSSSSSGGAGPLNLTSYLRHDPAWLALRQQHYNSELARRYPDIDKLGLPTDELADLKKLTIQRMQSGDDAREIAREQGLSPAEQNQAIQQAFAGVDSEVLALVGPDVTAKLATMDSQAAIRQQVQQMVGNDLANMNLPLTVAQMQALTTAVVPSAGPGISLADQIGRIAPGVLTPDQLAILQQSLDYQAQSQKIISEAAAAVRKDHPESVGAGIIFTN